MMNVLFLAMAVISSGLSSFFYKRVSQYTKSRAETALVSIAWFIPLTLVFGVAALLTGGIHCSSAVLLPALLAGLASAGCAFFLQQSMKQNSYSFSVIIVNLSFVFPILLSVLFLGEQTGWLQFAGIVIAIAVVVLIGAGGSQKGKTPFSAILLALAASFGNGLIDFAIKIQQHQMPGEGESSFFFFTYLSAAVFSGLLWGVFALRGEKTELHKNASSLAVPSLGIAACNGVCFFAISLLASHMNAAAQFTIITSLSIVLSLAIGRVRLKEHLRLREVFSLVFCAAAIGCQTLNI